MGHQQSALNGLNCKVKENNQKAEVIHNKEFFLKQHKKKQVKEQPQFVQNSFPTQNLIGNKSPRNQLTRATSQKNISSKSSRQQTVKPKIFIPQHQSITKVSQTAFPGSVKQKKFYVEQKLKSLGEIIQPRYNTTKHFPYSQILSLTETLVYSLAYMAKKNCNHHDFYPTNIFYVQGKFKVVNPLQVQASGFYLTSQRERFSFLAPELIISILQQVTQEDIGGYVMNKADVFSVGMILLEICSLQPSSECYDEESYNIVDSVIRDRLAKVVKVYTPVMAECINLMLQYEVDGRLDPVTLAQLVHWKIQNQKMTAMQMESPKPPQQGPQQGPPGKKGPMPQQGPPPGYPPNMLPPQQLRGPPPPPYMHQPFKLQNLNQNVIAVTVPNEQFTRIGPNNQGFLSSSSLQQKLRVIELIKEHPEEDQEAERQQNSRQEGAEQSNIADQKSQQNIYAQQKQLQYQQQQILQQQQVKKIVMVDKEEVNRPQYPMVESIYNEKPPMQQGSYEYEQKVNMMKPQLTKTQQRPILNPLTSYPQPMPKVYEENPPTRQQFTQEPKPSQAQVPRQQPYTIASLGQDPRTKYQAPYQPPSDLYSRPQPSQKFSLPQSYGISSPSISSPKHSPNIYTGTQQFQMQSQPLYEQIGTKKYGTSFQKNETVSDNASSTQTETLEERVQRVLNMSRNAR